MTVLILALAAAVLMDRLLGEPPSKFHPTAWMGRIIAELVEILGNSIIHGALIFLAITVPTTAITFLVLDKVGVDNVLGVILAFVILKFQFSWRALGEHADSVVQGLSKDIKVARTAVSRMVGRESGELDEEHVVSATVESIGESSVDGIIAPLFYFVVFGVILGAAYGVAAAVFYRAVNTLDSMIGYKMSGYHWLGFFSAKVDDLLNLIPARLASALLIVSAALIGEDARGAIAVYWRDKGNTDSPNSGHPMSALAGALGVQLEKVGFHRLGDPKERLTQVHIGRAVRLVDVSVLSFLALSLVILIV